MGVLSFLYEKISNQFLAGFVTGVLVKLVSDILFDKHKDQKWRKNERVRFKKIFDQMPDFLGEIKEALSNPSYNLVREFFVIPDWQSLNAENCFVFKDDGVNNYLHKVTLLVDAGYVTDITPSNAKMFRMADHFVSVLLNR